MIIIVIKPREIARAFLPFLLVVVMLAGLYPDYALPGSYNVDKVVQIAAFGTLAMFACAAFTEKRRIPLAVALCLLALTIENLQGYMPGRDATLDDGLASCAGVLLGCIGWYSVEKALGLQQGAVEN